MRANGAWECEGIREHLRLRDRNMRLAGNTEESRIILADTSLMDNGSVVHQPKEWDQWPRESRLTSWIITMYELWFLFIVDHFDFCWIVVSYWSKGLCAWYEWIWGFENGARRCPNRQIGLVRLLFANTSERVHKHMKDQNISKYNTLEDMQGFLLATAIVDVWSRTRGAGGQTHME